MNEEEEEFVIKDSPKGYAFSMGSCGHRKNKKKFGGKAGHHRFGNFGGFGANFDVDIDTGCCAPSFGGGRALYQEVEDDSYVVMTQMPGIDKSTLRVQAKPFHLKVEADVMDQYSKLFGPSMKIKTKFREEVDPNNASAKYSDGVLTIRIPLANPGTQINVE